MFGALLPEICNLALSTMDRGDTAVRGEAVRYRFRVKFGGPHGGWWYTSDERLAQNLRDHDRAWEVEPMEDRPATTVSAGGDGRVVSDAEVEAAYKAFILSAPDATEYDRECIRAALEAAERTRNEMPSAAVTVSHPVFAFLLGSGELDGKWFGDKNPSDKPFWWRKHLQAALAAAPGGKGRHRSDPAGDFDTNNDGSENPTG